ncbi:MAG: LCP family protein [Lachnospiraceae bacterium]|nr:LCP family protein [Lachnospiraceae bacterium]
MSDNNQESSQAEKNHWRKEVGSRSDKERNIRRIKRIGNVIAAWTIVIGCVVIVAFIVFLAARAIGERRLRAQATSDRPDMDASALIDTKESLQDSETETTSTWKEGWIRYQGKIYEYNEDLMTFLVMGIDKNGEVTESTSAIDGGQADAIFLVVANPDEKKLSLIGINRDTMVDINAIDMYGNQTQAMAHAQIAVQHGYGDGKELSCELMEQAVSNLFYQLPIHGYVSINMDAIPALNDAVGGVTLTAMEDVYATGVAPTKDNLVVGRGQDITLSGQEAYYYVRYRNKDEFESARLRLSRQKQYLECFLNQAKTETKKDMTLPVSVYQKLSKYMVTDITVDEISYLASEYVGYSLDKNGIYSLEGETKMGEISEEFYPDEDALVDLMVRIFYREVD